MRKYLDRVLICLVAIFVCCIPFLFQPSTGMAQFDSPLPEPNPIALWYAENFHVSYEEAEYRLNLQEEMTLLQVRIMDSEPTYAGSWVENEPEFGLVVAFASPDGKEFIKKYLAEIEWADLVRVQERPYTFVQLEEILDQVNIVAHKTEIPFASGLAPQNVASITIFTPHLEELRPQLEADTTIQPYLNLINFVYQESLSVPAEVKYPYLPGGQPISNCTAGFAVIRNSDGRRFMSTAGHCPNTNMQVKYNSTDSIFLGPMIFENNPAPTPPATPGPHGDNVDFQAHEVAARNFHLTNAVRTGPSTTASVVSAESRSAAQVNQTACKYGSVTGYTCGIITTISYMPGTPYGTSNDYVLVQVAIGPLACPGDSGSPVYKNVSGGVSALGLLATARSGACAGSSNFFSYSPVDKISVAGYSIVTSRYPQRYVQNVWWTETSCNQYTQEFDDNGNKTGPNSSGACGNATPAPPPPAPTPDVLQTYTGYVTGNFWREGMWRSNKGWVRDIPLNTDGSINWGAASIWVHCCTEPAGPRSQDGYVVGNHFYQIVYWSETNCIEYKRALDDNGNPTGATTSGTCRTTLPLNSSGTIQSYTAYVAGGVLHEGMWRGGTGFARTVPLNAQNTDVAWPSPTPVNWPSLSGTPPRAQGGYLLSYP